MKSLQKTATTLSLALLLSACVTMNAHDSAIEAGGEVVSNNMLELIGDDGVTAYAANGNWVAYWDADGRKAIKSKRSSDLIELKWRKNDAGEFCEQLYSAGGKEFCGNEAGIVTIKNSDGSFSDFKDGKSTGSIYILENGNSKGL